MHSIIRTSAVAALVFIAACGGEKKPAESAPPAASGPATPCPTCKVIDVTVTTNEKGNFFTPAEFEAHEGDVMHVTLLVGVHNVHFLPDSNPGKSNLPPASDMLQLPGQSIDIPLNFGKGKFYFQCDPHAALGMKGHVTVE
jgi:plastocyanin